MAITKGYSFGSTELVTNTKLHNMVDNATISGIVDAQLSSLSGSKLVSLASIPSTAGVIPNPNKFQLVTLATNASVPNIALGTCFKVYSSTYCSIASFTGMVTGQQFTLIMQQASFPGIVDTGAFKLSGNFIPVGAQSTLTLIWDGDSFVEVGRSNT